MIQFFMPIVPIVLWHLMKRLSKWLRTDQCHDVIVPLGPKEAGKSELRDAILDKPFNKERIGTTTTSISTFQLGEKWFIDIPDAGGDENIIKTNMECLCNLVKEKRAEHVLIALTFDLQDIRKRGVEQVADDLKLYVNMLARGTCNDDTVFNVCSKGNWCYCVIGTHADKMGKVDAVKEEASKVYMKLKEKLNDKFPYMKEAPQRGVYLADLQSRKGRVTIVEALVNILKSLGGE